MSTDLETRLTEHFDAATRHLPNRGPGLPDAADVVLTFEGEQRMGPPSRRGMWVAMAAAAAVLLVGGLVVARNRVGDDTDVDLAASSDGSATSPQDPTIDGLQPVATMPDGDDLVESLVTVVGSEPLKYVRIAPDLDIAVIQESGLDARALLCWRTPVQSDCRLDDGETLIVPTAGGQTLVVGGTGVTMVQLDDGTGLEAPVVVARPESDPATPGVARFVLPAGTQIVAVTWGTGGDQMRGAPEDIVVTGDTLPPAADLVEVPLTVPAGSDLSYYRFLPDLDISDRQTADGGNELCWRTPVGHGCLDDDLAEPVKVIPTDGAVIVLTRPKLTPIDPPPSDPLAPASMLGDDPTAVTVTFSDGTSARAPVVQGTVYGVWFGRVDLPAGAEVVSTHSE